VAIAIAADDAEAIRRSPTEMTRAIAILLLSLLLVSVTLGCADGDTSPSKKVYHPDQVVVLPVSFEPPSNESSGNATFEVIGPLNETVLIWTNELDDKGNVVLQLRLPENAANGTYLVFATHRFGSNTTLWKTTFDVTPRPIIPKLEVPLLWAVAGLCLVAIGAALVSIEWTRYSLVVLLLPLFSRMLKDEVLDNKTRYAIHGIVIENPGIHYNAIQREFGLTNGAAAYHLRVLEREDFIRSVRDGRLRRFYSRTTKVPEEKRLTPEQIRERVLELVTARPGMSQREIVLELGIERDTVGYHLRILVSEGKLQAGRKGRYMVYRSRKLT